jgi:hypothetical protein
MFVSRKAWRRRSLTSSHASLYTRSFQFKPQIHHEGLCRTIFSIHFNHSRRAVVKPPTFIRSHNWKKKASALFPSCPLASASSWNPCCAIMTARRLAKTTCVCWPIGSLMINARQKFHLSSRAWFCRISPAFPYLLTWRRCAQRCPLWAKTPKLSNRSCRWIWWWITRFRWITSALPMR